MTIPDTGQLPDWNRIDKGRRLQRRFTFPDFAQAFAFVTEIAKLAEAADHHPELELGWGRVVVNLTTHDESGVSQKDIDLARRIDSLTP